MPDLVYECIECGYRVPGTDERRATLACPQCRGVMKRAAAP
jgi:DNA-directed RNA polymerase subunit RPC12/RpoP